MPQHLSTGLRHPRPPARLPGGRGKQQLPPAARAVLEREVERRVVPALAAGPFAVRAVAGGEVAVRDVGMAVTLSIGPDGSALAAFVTALSHAGASPEAIYDGVLIPAARRLGVMWQDDTCSFADLTLGLLRLQGAQRALSPAFRGPVSCGDMRPAAGVPRLVLMPAPGEQHVFGLSMVADHFVRAGWDAQVATPSGEAAALRLVRRIRPDVVGLTLGSDDRIPAATRLIACLRRDVRGLLVLVGGPSVLADPGLPARMGADSGARDGADAVERARALMSAAAHG